MIEAILGSEHEYQTDMWVTPLISTGSTKGTK